LKKNFKRTLAKVMAVALTVSMVGVASTDADAAKKIKLSSKSISVAKGATKKVTIKNVKAKKVKKLTVKSKNKKIATVKKAGKTAFKVTGKKAGKSTKVTVKVKVGKKTTKLTLKVKVTKAKKKVVTPATTAPTPAASASATPAASASATPAASASATPAASASATTAPTTAPSEEPTPAPTAPVQPAKPSTPAKQMPELNLREEAATEWSKVGNYGTAIFNTDDTVSYSSYAWAKKTGDCYNNGIAWYIDPVKKGKVDLSAYTDLELTIKTDAEIAFLTWGGSTDPEYFWDKKDVWGAASKTVENADGSKTITYNLEKVFGNAAKVKKAVLVGITLKSDKDGNDKEFAARTATIYGIKFVNNGNAGNETGGTETSNVETSNVETSNVDTADVETKDPTEAPAAKPIKTLDANGYTSFESLNVGYDASKTYKSIDVKIKAYNATGALVTKKDENYNAFAGYSKLTVGTSETVGNGTGDGASGHNSDWSKTWGIYFFSNVGKYGVEPDADGYITLNLGLEKEDGSFIPTSDFDGFGFQTTTNAAGIPKIEIYEVTFNE